MALAGIDALRVLGHFRRADDQIRQRYLAENHVLNDIRSDVYVSGTYVRDYLLEPEPQRAETYRANLEQVRKHMEAALDSYGREVVRQGCNTTPRFVRNWRTIGKFWLPSSTGTQPSDAAPAMLSARRGFPRRQNMLALAARIADLNEQQLDAGNHQVVSLLVSFQTRLLLTLIAALALGLGLALFTMRRILNLEGQARSQYRRSGRSARPTQGTVGAAGAGAGRRAPRRFRASCTMKWASRSPRYWWSCGICHPDLRTASEEQSRRHVETIKGLVENTVRVVRNMALLLRPSMLDDLGLIPALQMAGPGVFQEYLDGRQRRQRSSIPMSCRTNTRPASIAWCRKRCTIARVILTPLRFVSAWSRARPVAAPHSGRWPGIRRAADQGSGSARHSGACYAPGRNMQVRSQRGSGTTLSIELPCIAATPVARDDS